MPEEERAAEIGKGLRLAMLALTGVSMLVIYSIHSLSGWRIWAAAAGKDMLAIGYVVALRRMALSGAAREPGSWLGALAGNLGVILSTAVLGDVAIYLLLVYCGRR